MSDPGLTSEQRAAIAVHNATQNRMCLNLSGNGQICVACSEVADQIDAAIAVALVGASEALSQKESALAAERARVVTLERANEMLEEDRRREKARADAAEALYADSETARMVARNAELTDALAAARRDRDYCAQQTDAARRECEATDSLFIRAIAGLVTGIPDEPERFGDWLTGRVYAARSELDKLRKARAARAAPAAGEEGKR